jgi:hypothetical protein
MNKSLLFKGILLVSVIGAAGCGTTRTEEEFGDSVREVMSKQIYDVNAGAYAGTKPVMGADPSKLENVLESYRGDGTGIEESYMTTPDQR